MIQVIPNTSDYVNQHTLGPGYKEFCYSKHSLTTSNFFCITLLLSSVIVISGRSKTGADPGFPVGGDANPPMCANI